MGCGGSVEAIDLDLSWTATELGDYILDLEEEKIKTIFECKESKPKAELVDVLHLSLFFYLIHKNQRANPKKKAQDVENQMEAHRNDAKFLEELGPMAKWMLENKIPRTQSVIKPDDYAETIGKWFDKYTEAMSGL
eukprot:UN02680